MKFEDAVCLHFCFAEVFVQDWRARLWLWGWVGGHGGVPERRPAKSSLRRFRARGPGPRSMRQGPGAQKNMCARQGWGPEAEVQHSGPWAKGPSESERAEARKAETPTKVGGLRGQVWSQD